MAKRKTFEHGQEVEVQRDVNRPWEAMTYDRLATEIASKHGYHRVRLIATSSPLYLDTMSGSHHDQDDVLGRRYRVHHLIVPSVRVRARKEPPR